MVNKPNPEYIFFSEAERIKQHNRIKHMNSYAEKHEIIVHHVTGGIMYDIYEGMSNKAPIHTARREMLTKATMLMYGYPPPRAYTMAIIAQYYPEAVILLEKWRIQKYEASKLLDNMIGS